MEQKPELTSQPQVGSSEWLDALHPILEEAAQEYFAKWPALDHGQHLAFQDAVLLALQKARRQGASNATEMSHRQK